ncbi:ESPR-type extended signal peptide-containing protein [Mitsuokella sp.]
MNRIFKVIWSKTKHCYIVVSEYAKANTKAAHTGLRTTAAAAAVAAMLLAPVNYAWAADTVTVTDTSTTQQTMYTKDGADNTFVKKGSDNGQSLTIGVSDSEILSTHQYVTGAQTTYDGLNGQVVTQATGGKSSISLKVGNSGDLNYNFQNYSEVTTTKDGGTTFTYHYEGGAQTIDDKTTIKGNTVTTGRVTASNGVVDKTTQDGAIVKTDKTIGENVTNLDAALAKETAARIGADKAQDAVIQQVNQNAANGIATLATAYNNEVASREAADTAINNKLAQDKTDTALHVTKDGNLIVGTKENQTVKDVKIRGQLTSGSVSTGNITATGDAKVAGKVEAEAVYDDTTKPGNYVVQTNSVGSNLSVLDTQVKANADAVATKANAADVYTKTETDSKVDAVKKEATTYTYRKVAAEEAARKAADNELNERITNEANAIHETTNQLQSDLSEEAKTRESKDNELNERITNEANAIHDEIKAGDTALDNRITAVKESLQQEAADTYVSKADAAVQDGAIVKADKTIGENVTNLDAALAKETADRLGADKAQDKVIQQVNQNMVDGFNTINKNMADGFTALNNADLKEAQERAAADTVLDDKITAETSARVVADTKLVEAVNSGLSLSNDNVLQKNTTTIDAQGNVTTSKTDANEMILNKGKDNQITLNEKGIKVGLNSGVMDKDGFYAGGDTAEAAKAALNADGSIKGADGKFTVDTAGNVATKGGSIKTNGGVIQTGGGNINTQGGALRTNGGNINAGSGTITGNKLTDGVASLQNGNLTTTGNINAHAIVATGDISGKAITGTSLNTQGGDINGGAITGTTITGTTGTFGSLTTTGNASVGGTLSANGLINTGNATTDTLTVNHNATVGGNLAVTGDITGKSLNVGTGAISGGQITGTGLDVGAGIIKTTGAVATGTLETTGNATIGGNLTVDKNLTVNGTFDAKTLSSTVDANNYTTINGGKTQSMNLKMDAATGETKASASTFDENGSNTWAKDDDSIGKSTVTADGISQRLSDTGDNPTVYAERTMSQGTDNKYSMVDTVKDGDKTNVASQSATESSDVVTDANGNTSTFRQRVDAILQEINNADGDTLTKVEQTDTAITSQIGDGSAIKSVMNADGIANIATGKSITNDAADIINTGTNSVTNQVGSNKVVVDTTGVKSAYGDNTYTTWNAEGITNSTDGNMTNTVGGNKSETVTGTSMETVTGKKTETYNGGLETTVTGEEKHTVNGSQTNSITGDQVNTIGGKQTTTVIGDVTEDYKANLSTTIGGSQTTTVTGDSSLTADNINNTAKNKITNKALDVETDAASSIVSKVSNDAGSNTSTQLSDQTKEEMSQADGKTASYLRGAAEEKSQLIDGDKKTTIDTVAGQTNTNITEGKNISNSLQKADQAASSVTDGTNTTVVNQNAKSLASSITDGTKANNTNSTVDKSEQLIKAGDTQYSATTKTATKMEDALVSGSSIIDVIKNLDDAANPSIGSAVTDGTNSTGVTQTAKDITNTAKNGTIANEAKDITNNATENMTNTVGKDLTTTVGGNETRTVEGTLTETVTGDVTEDYKANLSTKVGGNQTTTVTGDSSLSAKNITNTASEKITNQIGDGSAVKSEMTADGITNTAEGGTIYNKSKDILNEASGDILNFADGEIGNSATKITNLTGDNTVTSDTNGTTFENKAHSTAVKEGTVTKTTISGNTITTGEAVMDYADVMKDLGVRGNAAVDGNTTLGKEGAETTLTVNSTSTFKKDVTMKENATVEKDLTVNGKSTLIDDVTMKSNATVEKNLTVNGQSTFNNKVTITNGGLDVTGGTQTDTLHVTGASNFDGMATFKDIVKMEKDLSVGGNATVTGDVTASSYKVGDKTYIDANGINANGQKITNVAAGTEDSDAANYGQLRKVETRVDGVENRVTNVENRVDKMDSRIDKVGANAAAMANLHPLEFDEDSKWNVAAAVGNYKGETAAAVGAFYRPNEDVMFNLSTTFGNDENMVGGGLSLRLGKGGNREKDKKLKAAIAENNDLRAKVDDLTARMDALLSVINPNMSKEFPDVPENHWAYEAVTRLAGNNIVEGYEDGKFHGERTMTRYEMAEIIYNALSKGAKAEKKLVEEFKPELQAMAAQKQAK